MNLNIKSPFAVQGEDTLALVSQPNTILRKEDSKFNFESCSTSSKENSFPEPKSKVGLLLKLNRDDVLDAWSDKGSRFFEDFSGFKFSGSDPLVRLAQIDLFAEFGALKEAGVQRYKEKRRTHLFSMKIRYQVRKVNAVDNDHVIAIIVLSSVLNSNAPTLTYITTD